MKSETDCREELEKLLVDLKFWQEKFNKATDPDKRRILGTTIAGVQGQQEAIEWVLETHLED